MILRLGYLPTDCDIMYASNIYEGSGGDQYSFVNGIMVYKFKDCCKKVDFMTLSAVMFKFHKFPDKMTYDEYLVYAVMVEL